MSEKGFNALKTSWFDVISGLSGIGRYLLYRNENSLSKEKIECIKRINKYLIGLAVYREIDGHALPNWYVNGDNQSTDKYREEYPHGSINYSFSHGIAGVLMYLAKSMRQGIIVDGQKQALEFILNELEHTRLDLNKQGCLWPGMVGYEDYIALRFDQDNRRLSWCYGSMGNLIAVLEAAIALQDKNRQDSAIKELYQLADMDINQYHLYSPIICHGYAGTAVMFYHLYRHFFYPMFKEKGNMLICQSIYTYNRDSLYGFRDVM